MQAYKLVVRSLVAGDTNFDQAGNVVNQNFAEFTAYLTENYLEQGYQVLSVDFVSKTPANEFGSPVTYEFAYHLVKTVIPASSKDSAKDKSDK